MVTTLPVVQVNTKDSLLAMLLGTVGSERHASAYSGDTYATAFPQ